MLGLNTDCFQVALGGLGYGDERSVFVWFEKERFECVSEKANREAIHVEPYLSRYFMYEGHYFGIAYIEWSKERDAVDLVDDDVEVLVTEVAKPMVESPEVDSHLASTADDGVAVYYFFFGGVCKM